MQISELKKYNLQIFRKKNDRNTKYQIEEIQITEAQKYKWQENRNASDFWIICHGWL